MEKENMTGYPSIDKPWLKYYKKESQIPHMTAYEYLKERNQEHLELNAIDSEVGNYTYKELFEMIEKTAASLYELGIKKEKSFYVCFRCYRMNRLYFMGLIR